MPKQTPKVPEVGGANPLAASLNNPGIAGSQFPHLRTDGFDGTAKHSNAEELMGDIQRLKEFGRKEYGLGI